MTVQHLILAVLLGGVLIFAIYYGFAIIFIHKKLFDKYFYFVLGCLGCSSYLVFELLFCTR
ncbi:MAG: hypothetical protein HW421_1832 [Ignavibacteria bacterium]|nr:hypothetical protein [Ignavibacteria bacterium]